MRCTRNALRIAVNYRLDINRFISRDQLRDILRRLLDKRAVSRVRQVRLPGIENDTVYLACIQNREILAAASELKCEKPGRGRTIVWAPAHSARIVKPEVRGVNAGCLLA
jgi:hypothetical protein